MLKNAQSYLNLNEAKLIELAIKKKEGKFTSTGAFAASTGKYTGRSPRDKFIVDDELTNHKIHWGETNQPISEKAFDQLFYDMSRYIDQQKMFILDAIAGADPAYQLPIRILTEYAWHNLFAKQLFIPLPKKKLNELEFQLYCVPSFKADPNIHHTNSETFIVINLTKKMILIGGTEYAGEIKKSIFSVMNFLLPERGVLPMHCSANQGESGDVALFFGLSGTGKTTLSADSSRKLIGDDEHGWTNKGVFNIEGGCYAKCIGLSEEKEPEIFQAIQWGSVLENVVINDHSRKADYNDASLTENTRAAYPLQNIPNAVIPSVAGHPNVIFFLTADAFGVLPPISKLTVEQAMFYFLSGYTSKLAGTERGVTVPEATFSACFAEPFLPLSPDIYAETLGQKVNNHNVEVYLINTGWIGGPYGIGRRIPLSYTRAMINAAINKELLDVGYTVDPIFKLNIPTQCPNVPGSILNPINSWADKDQYEKLAKELAYLFDENIKKYQLID